MMVSFIVIAYNEERNIERTLRAILAQKDLSDYEVVVVNDGSKDKTVEVVTTLAAKHTAIRIVDLQPNQGRGAARAAGVAAAKGRYFAFVDADIVLPEDWLARCLPYMKTHDACGGIAVPDGDVAYVHRVLRLTPKVAPHSTTVTGSNGLFKREVFDKVSFNPKKKNGEDVDLGYQILEAGFRTIAVPGLLVEHNETKTYGESIDWLFTSGRGASRQFYEHTEVRLPDLAFFGFICVSIAAIITFVWLPITWFWPILWILAYVSGSSFMHLQGKFELSRSLPASFAGVVINDSLLLAYYLGRTIGMITEWKI